MLDVLLGCFYKVSVRGGDRGRTGTGQSLIFTVAMGVILLIFFGCFKFLMRDAGALFKVDVPCERLTLPVKVSFCAFRRVSCVISMCQNGMGTRRDLMGCTLCMSVFPRLITKPVIYCKSVRGRLATEGVSKEGLKRKTVLFVVKLTGGTILTGAVKGVFRRVTSASTDDLAILVT